MIKIKNASKTFKSGKTATKALAKINLQIRKGEFIAIVGQSGSGKTSLLNLVGGLDTPTGGEIYFDSKNIAHFNDEKLSSYRNHEVGFIFQEFNLEPHLSVKDNVLLPTFFNHRTSQDEQRALKLIEEVKLKKKTDSIASELSGGEKQRTAIARALINNPKVIIADEPTGNLDEKTSKTIIDLLKRLHKEHSVTLIIATHDLKIAKVADRIIKIEKGELKK